MTIRPSIRRFLLLIIGVIMLGGCIQTSSEPEIVATRLVQSPTEAPLPTEIDFQAGAESYAANCAPCHGETGLGDGVTASAFTCPVFAFAIAEPTTDLHDWFDTTTNGLRQSETCIMPPWNQRLNSDQIWEVVAYAQTLRYDNTLQPQGEIVLAEYQTGDTSYLADANWQTDNTDQNILTAITDNTLEGFDFSGSISEDDQQAALVHIRSLAFGDTFTPTNEVAQAPPPISTEEAEPQEDIEPVSTGTVVPSATPADASEETSNDATETVADDAAPIATEDAADTTDTATDTATIEGTYTINGTLVAGTEGGSLPTDQVIRLRVVVLGADDQPSEVVSEQTTANPDGTFTFVDIPRHERGLTALQTEYAGIQQFLNEGISSDSEGTLEIEFPIYETTTDDSDINITSIQYLVDASSAEGGSLIFQNVDFLNTGDRIYVGENNQTVSVTLPSNATNVQTEASTNVSNRFTIDRANGQTVVYDSLAMVPNVQERVVTTYNLPYEGRMTIEQAFGYDVAELFAYIAQRVDLELDSEQLTLFNDNVQFNSLTYHGYELAEVPLAANETISFDVFDGENVASSTPSDSVANTSNDDDDDGDGTFLADNATLIIGILGLLLIGAGMYMYYDLQRQKIKASGGGSSVPDNAIEIPDSKDELIAAIAELDEAYEAGDISETDYRIQREVLKTALRQYIA